MNIGLGVSVAILSIKNQESERNKSREDAIELQNRIDRINLDIYIENQEFIKRVNNANN